MDHRRFTLKCVYIKMQFKFEIVCKPPEDNRLKQLLLILSLGA